MMTGLQPEKSWRSKWRWAAVAAQHEVEYEEKNPFEKLSW